MSQKKEFDDIFDDDFEVTYEEDPVYDEDDFDNGKFYETDDSDEDDSEENYFEEEYPGDEYPVQKMNMTMLSTALPTESVRSGILPKKNRNMKPEKEVIHAPGKEVEFLLQLR